MHDPWSDSLDVADQLFYLAQSAKAQQKQASSRIVAFYAIIDIAQQFFPFCAIVHLVGWASGQLFEAYRKTKRM